MFRRPHGVCRHHRGIRSLSQRTRLAAGSSPPNGGCAHSGSPQLRADPAGAPPLLPEAVRVRAALESGASLVFALPAPWAMSGAESFARAGVKVLAAAGCDALVFGAETPDAALLTRAARVLASPAYREALKQQLAAGARNFAAARQAAVEQVCPGAGLSQLLDRPNNNLAVEYCKAILELKAPLTPVPLPRQGQTMARPAPPAGMPAPAPSGPSGPKKAPRPWPPMCPGRLWPFTGKHGPPGSTPISGR